MLHQADSGIQTKQPKAVGYVRETRAQPRLSHITARQYDRQSPVPIFSQIATDNLRNPRP